MRGGKKDKMKKKEKVEYLYRITAYSRKADFRVEMFFKSVQEAIKNNPDLEDFQILGVVRSIKKKQNIAELKRL